MRYTLMHKAVPVVTVMLDDATGTIYRIEDILNAEHLPIGLLDHKGQADRAALNEWWLSRSIPASRDGLWPALETLQISSPRNLLDKCFGLSLSDQYWICPEGADLQWENINFFQNAFSEDVGNVLLGGNGQENGISLMSPDNTSDGWLKKKWTIIAGKRCLIKGGSGTVQQEPYNEVIASSIMERLGIPHVAYKLAERDGYPYSVCEDFITPDTDLVTAWYIMHTQPKLNHTTLYQHFLSCCDALGIPGMTDAIDRMLVLDYLIVNEDRHQNNYGVVRNADTLEFLGAAPIYDSGSSLWFTRPTPLIQASPERPCKPFKKNHSEQIKLVTSFEWLDLSKLKGIDEEIREIIGNSAFIDEARRDALIRAAQGRVDSLGQVMENHKSIKLSDTTEHDVKEDTAYSGPKLS